jgi:Domain of unknown function (DUF4157)
MRWFTSRRDNGGKDSALSVEPDAKSSSRPSAATGGDRLPVSVPEVLAMQRLVGNQAVLGMLRAERDTTGGGDPLDAGARAALGARLQRDFSDVRVHTDSTAAGAAGALGVQAFTRGKDIFFGEGKYQPRSDAGMRLLGHELAHVAQQDSRSGGSAVADRTLEQEADRAEAPGPAGGPMPVSSAGGARVQGKAEPGKEGFWHSVGGAIAGAGEAIWEGLKTVGSGIATAAGAVWGAIKWLGTQIWDKVTGVLQRMVTWVTRLPARVGRLMTGLIHGLSTVRPWTLAWWESLTHLGTWGDFLSWVGARLIDVLEILGVGEALETVNEFVKFNTRALSSREVTLAERVFGKSIDLTMVRIDEAAVLGPAFTKRAFTSFHTINAWGGLEDSVLVHELTHVWQYEQAGAIYMAQALHAQIRRGLGAYDYGGPDGLRAARTRGMPLTGFNREEQAQIVQDFFLIKHGQQPGVPGGTPADLPLYAHFVKKASTLSESELLA